MGRVSLAPCKFSYSFGFGPLFGRVLIFLGRFFADPKNVLSTSKSISSGLINVDPYFFMALDNFLLEIFGFTDISLANCRSAPNFNNDSPVVTFVPLDYMINAFPLI